MIYVLAFCALVMFACAIACWLADDTVETEPTKPALPAHEQCAINDCPRAWQTERHGWRLCHTHYRQLVDKDGAA